jgi:hypothetical protein
MSKINVLGTEISVILVNNDDFISLTDMIKAKGNGDVLLFNWLRNRNTIEFLGIWERVHNPYFNYIEFDIIKSHAGLNSYVISFKEWIEKTNAIGIQSRPGRYGGTYAHKDIAFEFGMWISAEFKVYLIKEFQRLKEQEYKQLGWDIRRNLTKLNYRIHTDAIKINLIPPTVTKEQANFKYAEEADILNVALFGMTAAQWRKQNPKLDGNIRDYADIAQLVCLANLESLNAHLINDGVPQEKRIVALNKTAISQMKILTDEYGVKKLEGKTEKEKSK